MVLRFLQGCIYPDVALESAVWDRGKKQHSGSITRGEASGTSQNPRQARFVYFRFL
jgi:hypothetical protein